MSYQTEKYIIDQINSDFSEEKRLVTAIHDYLKKVYIKERMAYTCALDDLYMEYKLMSLVKREWGGNILCDFTYNKIRDFEQAWRQYRRETEFGEDEIFVYRDKKWTQIVTDYLLPVLQGMENNFDDMKIKYSSYLDGYVSDTLLTDEDVLQRARVLYGLLLKHGIIKKKP